MTTKNSDNRKLKKSAMSSFFVEEWKTFPKGTFPYIFLTINGNLSYSGFPKEDMMRSFHFYTQEMFLKIIILVLAL